MDVGRIKMDANIRSGLLIFTDSFLDKLAIYTSMALFYKSNMRCFNEFHASVISYALRLASDSCVSV